MQVDAQKECGWKLVHGDVFRPPGKGMLLSVMLGTGTQVIMMTSITLGKFESTESLICYKAFMAAKLIQSVVDIFLAGFTGDEVTNWIL